MTQPFGSEHTMSLIIKDNFEDFSGNRILSADTITFETIDNIAPDFVAGSAKIDSVFYVLLQNNPSQNSRRYCNVQLSIDDNIITLFLYLDLHTDILQLFVLITSFVLIKEFIFAIFTKFFFL